MKSHKSRQPPQNKGGVKTRPSGFFFFFISFLQSPWRRPPYAPTAGGPPSSVSQKPATIYSTSFWQEKWYCFHYNGNRPNWIESSASHSINWLNQLRFENFVYLYTLPQGIINLGKSLEKRNFQLYRGYISLIRIFYLVDACLLVSFFANSGLQSFINQTVTY